MLLQFDGCTERVKDCGNPEVVEYNHSHSINDSGKLIS